MKMKSFLLISLFVFSCQASRYALISVSDKTNIVPFAQFLIEENFIILSTGGTYRHLYDSFSATERERLQQVSDITKFPEILNGRVKTLHPKIAGGILARRNNVHDQDTLSEFSIPWIDVVVVNLYPFQKVVNTKTDEAIAREMIDIGGVTLLRAAAKNEAVTAIVDPDDYDFIMTFPEILYDAEFAGVRKNLASKVMQHTACYDASIANWMVKDTDIIVRTYCKDLPLKYGCNPHQKQAGVYAVGGQDPFFELLNGKLGYINVLDAIGSWNLVKEVDAVLDKPCVASFKHTSPAGVAVPGKLSQFTQILYSLEDSTELSDVAYAYLRARNGDPRSSFGDFIACSRVVDRDTAQLIKTEVSDGIIAPGFEPEALALLQNKKGGSYVILQVDSSIVSTETIECREIGGLALMQEKNTAFIDESWLDTRVTAQKIISKQEQEDLLLAAITAKYTQSNSVVYAYQGQVIGVGAGQQSRIDCVKLAGKKADVWWVRNHNEIIVDSIKQRRKDLKRSEKINLSVDKAEYMRNISITSDEIREQLFEGLSGVVLASDAFFPFRDNIEEAAIHGVTAIVQPGGSMRDSDVIRACDEYEIAMFYCPFRSFTH